MRLRVLLCLGAGLLLTGCVTTQTTCPPDVAFSIESQSRLADEMRAAVPEAEWPKYVRSYRALRKSCTAIAKVR